MLIADILEIVPEALDMMIEMDLHCMGCSGASSETLAMGMEAHGYLEKDVDDFIKKIIILHEKNTEELKEPVASDFLAEKIQEGNKVYTKLGGMVFSENAYKKLHELASSKGFQIRVEAGGCSGYGYKYDYVEAPESDESVYKLSDELDIYMSNFTFDKLKDSVVDFSGGIHGSGLKFINPNEKNACHCGSSVGF